MAHLFEKDGRFYARFTWDGQEYKRALKTRDEADAESALRDIENRIHDLYREKTQIPAGMDPGKFIVWGPNAKVKTNNHSGNLTFSGLVKSYLKAGEGFKAESTMITERIHLKNAAGCLGSAARKNVSLFRHRDLDAVLQARLKQVSATTVKKERQTIISLFDWAVKQDILESSPAEHLPTIKAASDRPRFQTLKEIEAITKRGGLCDDEIEDLWGCLYLNQKEICEILTLAKAKKEAQHRFVYPMIALVAYTGMRRGEILRLKWIDIDFEGEIIVARSRKQSRQRQETSREISLHPELSNILKRHKKSQSRGQHVLIHGKSNEPLTVDQATDHSRRLLKKTRWEQEMPSGKKKVVIGFHTFRHSFASNLAIQGVDQRIIDKWMGHTTEEMRKRYQHLFPQKLSEGIRSLSFAKSS